MCVYIDVARERETKKAIVCTNQSNQIEPNKEEGEAKSDSAENSR